MRRSTVVWPVIACLAVAAVVLTGDGQLGGTGNSVPNADDAEAHSSPPSVLPANSSGVRTIDFGADDFGADDSAPLEFNDLARVARGVSSGGASGGNALPDDSTEESRNPREPAIFDLLRASDGKPIPPRVRELAGEITKDATNAVGKARAIYDWLTRNIVYDTQEWENIATGGASGYIHDHDPESVLERGTTVCVGYAWLFDNLCEAAGIEATWLIGDVRGYRATPDEALVSDIRHAWNAVRLEDGQWHLLDATWGALQEGEEETPQSAARADYYFDTPASQFVYDHLPENEEWQLLDEPLPSETAFDELPNLKPSFFANGLQLSEDYTSALSAQPGRHTALAFSIPKGVRATATVGAADGGGEFIRIPVFRARDGNGGAVMPPLDPGDYVLRIYSGKRGSRQLDCSADFLIKVP